MLCRKKNTSFGSGWISLLTLFKCTRNVQKCLKCLNCLNVWFTWHIFVDILCILRQLCRENTEGRKWGHFYYFFHLKTMLSEFPVIFALTFPQFEFSKPPVNRLCDKFHLFASPLEIHPNPPPSSDILLIKIFNILSFLCSTGSVLRQGDNLHSGRAALQLHVQCTCQSFQYDRRRRLLGANWITNGRR